MFWTEHPPSYQPGTQAECGGQLLLFFWTFSSSSPSSSWSGPVSSLRLLNPPIAFPRPPLLPTTPPLLPCRSLDLQDKKRKKKKKKKAVHWVDVLAAPVVFGMAAVADKVRGVFLCLSIPLSLAPFIGLTAFSPSVHGSSPPSSVAVALPCQQQVVQLAGAGELHRYGHHAGYLPSAQGPVVEKLAAADRDGG